MKRVILNYVECQHTGEYGLMLDGVVCEAVYAASEGVLIAHDIIEHNGAETIGTFTDELEALGVVWWVRGEFNDIRRDGRGSAFSPYEHLASDIAYMAESIQHGSTLDIDCKRTRACDYDDDFQLIIEMAKKSFRENRFDDINVDIFRGISHVNRYFDCALHCMRRGYRKALKRYHKLGQCGTNSLFWDIANKVDDLLPYIDIGEQIDLRYSLTTGGMDANIVSQYD